MIGPFKTKGEARNLIKKMQWFSPSKHITATSLSICFRSNDIWEVFQTKDDRNTENILITNTIVFFSLSREKDGWYVSDPIYEGNINLPVTCPLGYFALVPKVKDTRWRTKVIKHHNNKKLAKEIRRVAKRKTVKILLNNTKVPEGILEEIWPMRIRYKGVLYRINSYDIKGYEVVE